MEKESRYQRIIEENKDRVFRVCYAYIPDPDERKDAFQEVLINIWKSLDTFREESQISTWIYRIAVNTVLGVLRSEQRRRRHFDPEASARIEQMPQADHTEAQEEMSQSLDRLDQYIYALPPVDRALIALYLEDVSTRECANILGITETNVRVKLHRIRHALKEQLQEKSHGA